MIDVTKSQLLHGDCLDVIDNLPDESIDVCLTDPPYGIDFKSKRFKKILNDMQPFNDWIAPLFKKMKPGGRLICFYRWDVQDAFLHEIHDAGFKVKSQLVWNKDQPGMGDLFGEFAPSHELMIYATKDRYLFKGKRPSTVLTYHRALATKQIHPNEKPIALIKDLIGSISEPNEVIFEPFAGSGVTYQACIETDRICIASELDDYYYAQANDRISKLNPHKKFF